MGLCLVSAQTRAATWEAVKPLGEADKAISASSTPRMRVLLRSIPPTMVLPTREAVGSCSSMSSAMQLEDRQIIRRSLDRDFPFGRPLGSPAINRAMPVSEDRLDGLQVQWSTAAIDEGLKHLVHLPAHLEDQVSTVFDLVVLEY